MTYTTLREAGVEVRRKAEFTGNNIYGRWFTDDNTEHSWYVVYSYGDHFPMYVYDESAGLWFGNRDKYSPSTSRHQSACHPPEVNAWYSTDFMKRLARSGFPKVAAERVEGVAHAA